jgi:hypothetical protein
MIPPLIDMLALCHCIQIEEVNLDLLTVMLFPSSNNNVWTIIWNVKYKILEKEHSVYYIFHDSIISIYKTMVDVIL